MFGEQVGKRPLFRSTDVSTQEGVRARIPESPAQDARRPEAVYVLRANWNWGAASGAFLKEVCLALVFDHSVNQFMQFHRSDDARFLSRSAQSFAGSTFEDRSSAVSVPP